MSKGIRAAVNALFLEKLPGFLSGEVTGAAFRKNVILTSIAAHEITESAACTHYNWAKKQAETAGVLALYQLGRKEGKNNGGRKKKVVEAVATETSETTLTETATETTASTDDTSNPSAETAPETAAETPSEDPVLASETVATEEVAAESEGKGKKRNKK